MINKIAIQRKNLIFNNKHDAYMFQSNYQKSGYIKKCCHAVVVKHPAYLNTYTLKCVEDSYRFVQDTEVFIGCPEECLFFQSFLEGILKKWTGYLVNSFKKTWLGFIHGIKWFFEWYSSLSTTVQSILALTFLFLTLGSNSKLIYLLLKLLASSKN